MSRADSMLKKASTILRRFTPLSRSVYKRTIKKTGGSALTGRAGTVTYTDVLCDPQPVYVEVTSRRFFGGSASSLPMLSSGRALAVGDLCFTFSGEAITTAELESPATVILLKDAAGHTETFEILGSVPSAMNAVTIKHSVYARSIKR